MHLTLSHQTALRALRVWRCARNPPPAQRHELSEPSPAPRTRWTSSIVPLGELGLEAPLGPKDVINVIVPSAHSRVRASFFSCRVQPRGLPTDSFVTLGSNVCIPCPELLFLQLAEVMAPEVHALLGYELCGTYSRSAVDPRLDDVAYDVAPVTSIELIGRYLDRCGRRSSVSLARRSLGRAADNAWSPMEAVVALMARLDPHEGGYGLGTISLNVRHGASPELVSLGCRESRVPDIEVLGTRVGFNYDSQAHLDLDSIVAATVKGDPSAALRNVREKSLDDLKRNRELAAMGHIVLPVTSSDLFAPGGLDAVMLEAALAMEQFDGRSADYLRAWLSSGAEAARRQRLIWSLLPWPEGKRHARELLESVPWKDRPVSTG